MKQKNFICCCLWDTSCIDTRICIFRKKCRKTIKEGRMSRVDYRLTFIDIMWQYHSSMCDIKNI